jgi:hypothetical protein
MEALPAQDMQGVGRVGYLLDPGGIVFGFISPVLVGRDDGDGRLILYPPVRRVASVEQAEDRLASRGYRRGSRPRQRAIGATVP